MPTPSAQHYEQVRTRFLDGSAPRCAIRVVRYHGVYRGLQRLLAGVCRAERGPAEPVASVGSDALARQVAALLLSRQPEPAHAI